MVNWLEHNLEMSFTFDDHFQYTGAIVTSFTCYAGTEKPRPTVIPDFSTDEDIETSEANCS